MKDKRPIGAEIRLASNIIKNYVDREMSKRFCLDITGVECMTLAFVFKSYPDAVVASDFMKRFGISKATVSQTLSGLEKKGYIKQKTAKADHRMKLIGLTKKGLDLKMSFDDVFKEINGWMEEGLTDEEKETLYRLLWKIERNCGFDGECVYVER